MDMATLAITLVVILLIVVGVAFLLWNAICPAIAPEMQNVQERPMPSPRARVTQTTPVRAEDPVETPPEPLEPKPENVVDLAEWRNRRAG